MGDVKPELNAAWTVILASLGLMRSIIRRLLTGRKLLIRFPKSTQPRVQMASILPLRWIPQESCTCHIPLCSSMASTAPLWYL